MNNQLNIVSIIDMLLRRWNIILLSAILVGVFSFVYSEVFIQPEYVSKATLYVNASQKNTNNEISSTSINSSRQLVMTYAQILQTRTFLGDVAKDVDGRYSDGQIRGMVSMSPLNETEIMSISVRGTNPEDVYKICDSITKRAEDELVRVVEAGSVKIIDEASDTKTPVSPNIRQNTFIGIFIGIFLGGLLVVVLELFDTRIKNGNEISQRYKEPLLGEIPSLVASVSSDPDSANKRA